MSTKSLITLLPMPPDPAPEQDFNGRALLLLAGAAHAGAMYDYERYRLTQEACRQIFGERALHAKLQARLHYALLNPPQENALPDLARELVAKTEEGIMPTERTAQVFKGALHILSADGQEDVARSLLISSLEAILCPPDMRRAQHAAGKESGSGPQKLPSRAGDVPAPESQELAGLNSLAAKLRDDGLIADVKAFQALLPTQPFRVVLTGERKRGKSTLLNALLGQVVSPVREAIPTTGSVALFHHAPTFSAVIRCFSASELASFESSLKADPKNTLLRRSLERIRQNFAASGLRPGQSRTLDTLEELCEALRADGPYSGILAQVDIGLPQMPLGTGTFLVDTPGLNATDRLLADLALDAGIAADCIIFVMDARDSASGSELTLLRRLATMGRGITVIGVLTHSDLIRDPAVLQAAKEQTRLMLQEACRHAGQVHVAGVVALNARQAMIDRCLRSKPVMPETGGEFATLLSMLREARTLDSDISRREGKIRSTFLRLKQDMTAALAEHSKTATSRMPGQELLAMLNAHATQLAEATRLSMEQARQTIEVAQADLDAWEGEIERSLRRFRETLTLRLMNAVNQTIVNSGKNFAKGEIWRKFDTQEAQTIARQCVDEFLEEQRGLLQEKEHRFQLFASEINACTKTCLATAAATLAGLEGASMVSGDSSDATHFLIQTRHYMKKLALVSGGAVLGRMSAVGPIALVISVGNMLALSISSPMIAVVVAAVAGTASVLYHLGREDKRRAMLLEKRRKEAESYASRIADALQDELVTAHAHIRDLYAAEISNGYTPALESLFHQATHLRLFIDTMDDIRSYATKQEREGQKQLEDLATQLLPGGGETPGLTGRS